MQFDLAPLVNATRRLREGLARYEKDRTDEQIRDGLIQRFEFTCELSHRMLRRYLMQATASPDEIAQMAFADLIRTAGAQRLVQADWPAWRRFREMRALTSHIYDASTALRVVAGIAEFLDEAEFVAAALQSRLA